MIDNKFVLTFVGMMAAIIAVCNINMATNEGMEKRIPKGLTSTTRPVGRYNPIATAGTVIPDSVKVSAVRGSDTVSDLFEGFSQNDHREFQYQIGVNNSEQITKGNARLRSSADYIRGDVDIEPRPQSDWYYTPRQILKNSLVKSSISN